MASSPVESLATPAKVGSSWPWTALLVPTIAIYLILSLWIAHTKAPWYDEGQYANSSYELAFHGRLATTVVEPSGFYLNAYFRGSQRRTYFTVPIQLVALAGWFRMFGSSASSARTYSICWGALTLLILFYILQRLFPDRWVAPVATLFTAVDFVFLWSTADARMDAAASALALASLAAYLHFRENDIEKAVIASQVLGAGAIFTHPTAALAVLAVAIVALQYDRGQIRLRLWRYLALAAAPYLIAGLCWLFYILQSPGDFSAQFLANAAGHNSERFRRLIQPGVAIGTEIDRHLAAYCIGGLWGGVMQWWTVVIPFLYLPAIVWFLRKWRRHEPQIGMFLVYAVAVVLAMTFLDGFKGYFYLIYLIPVYAAVLAAWLRSLWGRSTGGKCVATAVALAFVTIQISASVLHIRADEYHRDYEPAIRELARDRAEGKSIVGTAALGFGLDFRGLKDDARLGMYSGLDPDVLVVDRAYRKYAGLYSKEEPAVFEHIVELLSTKYRFASQHGSFWIFERAQPPADGKMLPWVDVRKIETVGKDKRAEYLFRLIFSDRKMHDPEESSL